MGKKQIKSDSVPQWKSELLKQEIAKMKRDEQTIRELNRQEFSSIRP